MMTNRSSSCYVSIKPFLFIASTLLSTNVLAYSQSDIVGTWTCTSADQRTGMLMQSTDTYRSNGTSSAKGVFTLNLPGSAQGITVNMNTKGTWSLQGNSIKGKLIDANATSPQFPQLAGLFKQQLQQSLSANSKILSLTKNQMTLLVASQNITVTCRK